MRYNNLQNKTALVLGWEFPPRMVGGLAIATYGIVEALRKHLHIVLIIPYKDENTPQLSNVTIYGLNEIEKDFPHANLSLLSVNRSFWTTKENILNYYPSVKKEQENLSRDWTETEILEISYNLYDAFKSEEVYGWGLWHKLDAYVEVVSLISEFISYDVIHCHDWLTYRAGIRLKEQTNKPLAIHVHALETDRVGSHVKNEVYNLEKKAMIAADVVMPVSEYTKRQIVRYYVNYPDNIVPIHNAVSKDEVNRWKHIMPQKIVTFLGRITAQKGPEYLLETIQKVVSEYTEVRFAIAGKGDMLASLISSSAYQGLSRYIIFAGFLSRADVNSLLSTSDIYFMPSVSEPFGLTALEAAHFQVPCVLTKQSGASEVLTSALTADFWDTDLFAKHIISLLKDEKLAKRIVNQSNKDLEKISWHNSSNKIAFEYTKLITRENS